MHLSSLKKQNDSAKHLQNKIKIWPMMSNLKQSTKKPEPAPAKPEPFKSQLLNSISLPRLSLDKPEPDRQVAFPDVSVLCSRLKNKTHVHNQSSKFKFGSISEVKEDKNFNRLEELDKFIKTCEIEKNSQKNRFIDGIASIQNEMMNTVETVNKLTSRPKPPNPKRRKENDYYYTRVQIKKLINELRACTKHIGN